MKKKAAEAKSPKSDEKSFFKQTGEVIGSIGAHIVNATGHVVEFVANEVAHARKTAEDIGKKAEKVAEKQPGKNKIKKIPERQKRDRKIPRSKNWSVRSRRRYKQKNPAAGS